MRKKNGKKEDLLKKEMIWNLILSLKKIKEVQANETSFYGLE